MATVNYLTANEVSDILKLSTKQVYELAKRRKIPGVKIGKYWRFEEAKLFKYIEQRYGNGFKGV